MGLLHTWNRHVSSGCGGLQLSIQHLSPVSWFSEQMMDTPSPSNGQLRGGHGPTDAQNGNLCGEYLLERFGGRESPHSSGLCWYLSCCNHHALLLRMKLALGKEPQKCTRDKGTWAWCPHLALTHPWASCCTASYMPFWFGVAWVMVFCHLEPITYQPVQTLTGLVNPSAEPQRANRLPWGVQDPFLTLAPISGSSSVKVGNVYPMKPKLEFVVRWDNAWENNFNNLNRQANVKKRKQHL